MGAGFANLASSRDSRVYRSLAYRLQNEAASALVTTFLVWCEEPWQGVFAWLCGAHSCQAPANLGAGCFAGTSFLHGKECVHLDPDLVQECTQTDLLRHGSRVVQVTWEGTCTFRLLISFCDVTVFSSPDHLARAMRTNTPSPVQVGRGCTSGARGSLQT